MAINYKELEKNGKKPEELANIFLKEYYKENKITYPINPFQMLKDTNVMFRFMRFKNIDGIYIPKQNEEDFCIVGLNVFKPITRQRFTAAHELCHYLKDNESTKVYDLDSKAKNEKYAEDFAAELLMPTDEFERKIQEYEREGYVDFDGILKIANYFGVSFQACLYRMAYAFKKVEGETSSDVLKQRASDYEPNKKCEEKGLSSVLLYEQMFDSASIDVEFEINEHTKEKFKTNYILSDSRLEGISLDDNLIGEIITDLRLNKGKSKYCKVENKNIIEVAGLTIMYDYIFNSARIKFDDFVALYKKLYSTAPYPELVQGYRRDNPIVTGGSFEIVDYSQIPCEMNKIEDQIEEIIANVNSYSVSEYIEKVVDIHHKLTIIHPFNDGNGRTIRAFTNGLLKMRNIPPAFFREKEKHKYKNALKKADISNKFDDLYECFYKAILLASAELMDPGVE